MANFGTLANVLAGCITQVKADACSSVFAAATGPTGSAPADTLAAAESIARYPWYKPERIFALLDHFYPYPKGNEVVRPTPFLPYLTFAPSAWVFPLKFTGGGLSGPGKLMIDSQGNAWAADNFIVGAQNMTRSGPGGFPSCAERQAAVAAARAASPAAASAAPDSGWRSTPTTTAG